MSLYKVGDRVKLNAEYLKPHTGIITQVQTFADGSPAEYGVQLDGGQFVIYLAIELDALTSEDNDE